MTWTATHEGEWVDVIPDTDLIAHEPGANCVCGPTIELTTGSVPLITHDSLDGRELTEEPE